MRSKGSQRRPLSLEAEKQTENEQQAEDLCVTVGDLQRHLDSQSRQVCYTKIRAPLGQTRDSETWRRDMYTQYPSMLTLPPLPLSLGFRGCLPFLSKSWQFCYAGKCCRGREDAPSTSKRFFFSGATFTSFPDF